MNAKPDTKRRIQSIMEDAIAAAHEEMLARVEKSAKRDAREAVGEAWHEQFVAIARDLVRPAAAKLQKDIAATIATSLTDEAAEAIVGMFFDRFHDNDLRNSLSWRARSAITEGVREAVRNATLDAQEAL